GPSQPLPKESLEAMERFMDRGGQMLVCLDIVADRDVKKGLKSTGLEEFLKKYGVQVTDDLIMRVPEGREDPQIFAAMVPADSKVSFARSFADQPFAMETAR